MNKRTIDEMIAHFNQEVSKMDIAREYKMALLGMITAIGYENKKQEVVRCKDCKHNKGTKVWLDGDVTINCDNGMGYPPPDWFCADGERKDDE